ncbi:hypothetical protein ACIQXD_34765 [Streptomyces uncialis]|uniref:hypothetical protein n=1 Tax=Streptomyces uncialis TaxID=1048205 RepID=UPI00381B21F4
MQKQGMPLCAALITALATVTLAGTASVANANGATPTIEDAHIFNPNEAGLFELQAPEPAGGGVQPQNFTSSLINWAPGAHESRHWADNDYTEIQFTDCTVTSGPGTSVDVRLRQAIPFSLDKDMGSKRFTNCFKGDNKTSRGEWDANYSNGDNRYFTVPRINGSESTRTNLNVRKVYVDTTKAD